MPPAVPHPWALVATLGTVLALATSAVPAAPDRTPLVVASKTDGRAKAVVVKGAVDCSDPVAPGGNSASPLSLSLASGGEKADLHYPNRMSLPGHSGVFASPVYEVYQFKTSIPAGGKSTTIRWVLTCQDQDGNAVVTKPGHFSVVRSATRDICDFGGHNGLEIYPCNPALDDKLSSCAFAIVTAATGSTLLDVTSLAADPPKKWQGILEEALSRAAKSPLVGLLMACIPVVEPTPTPTTAVGTTTTTSTKPDAWPTHRDDVNIAVSEWLGSDLDFPNWMSCDPNYCIAGDGQTVYVFRLHNLDQIGTVAESAPDPAAALAGLGIPPADIALLLAPTG